MVFVLITTACDRDHYRITLKGRVVNKMTNQPIDSVQVIVQDGIGNGGNIVDLGATTSDKRQVVYTDANGDFSIDFEGNYHPVLGIVKKGYFDWENGSNWIFVNTKKKQQDMVLTMGGYAGFCPYFKLSKESTESDTVCIALKTAKFKQFDYTNATYFGTEGIHSVRSFRLYDTINGGSFHEVGDSYTVYEINYKGKNKRYVKTDSVFICTGEMFTDTIYY